MSTAALSGLELLRASAGGKLPRASISDTMGMSRMEVEQGRGIIHAVADERHLNPLRGVHGGFAAIVLDSVTGCAVHSMLGPGVGYGTVDLDLKMMRPVPWGEDLVAEGRVTHISRSLGIAEGTLRDAAGDSSPSRRSDEACRRGAGEESPLGLAEGCAAFTPGSAKSADRAYRPPYSPAP